MDLMESLQSIANNIEKQNGKVLTEEATKNAFVMPFIKSLGYDVFNPDEVVPEFTADHGIKKGEKVDYVIMMNGDPTILIECKCYGNDLNKRAPSQLYRYYSVTKAKIGIVTDGQHYHFYTDLEEENKMDDRPYMELDLLDLDSIPQTQLKKLTKLSFDIDTALETATELKYTKEIRRKIKELIEDPTRDFVKLFASQVYDGRFTKKAQEQFTPIVKKAFKQFVRMQINNRIESAIVKEEVEDDPEESKNGNKEIVTTEEEIQGYHIVRAIVSEVIDPARVTHRDVKSYFGILIDDNNRQPVCRLHLNTSQWYISLFDEEKNKQKIEIESLDNIYKYGNQLKSTALSY